jgi:hypothetical protein
MNTKAFLLATSILVFIPACVTTREFRLTQIVVTAHGVDTNRPMSGCEGFNLTNRQARRFFARAKPVTIIEQQNDYLYSECIVFGQARYINNPVTWQIRAGGTASFRLHSGAIVALLADPAKRKAR